MRSSELYNLRLFFGPTFTVCTYLANYIEALGACSVILPSQVSTRAGLGLVGRRLSSDSNGYFPKYGEHFASSLALHALFL